MLSFDVVIVGGGHAGSQAAIALRQAKFVGSIAIVSADAEPPYERPPLSKDYLAGEKTFERILIRPLHYWDDHRVSLILGTAVEVIDHAKCILKTSTAGDIGYGALVWATGGTPRPLICHGSDASGVHTVRTREDVDRMRSELGSVRRVIVIGGGYIGLEATAVLVKLGKEVTIVEALDRVLARVAGECLSRFYEMEHRKHGVHIRLGASVECIEQSQGRVCGVRLSEGDLLECEMVIVGIGISPSVQPLLNAGAEGGNGVSVNEQCRTSLPGIFAIGDCALHANDFAAGMPIRLESVQNAHDQASVAARAILGEDVKYHAIPWFWSNQYDLRLQTIGLSTGHDAALVRGSMENRSFSVIYLKDQKVVALDCVNSTKDYVQGKALVASGAVIDPQKLVDTSVTLKDMLAAA